MNDITYVGLDVHKATVSVAIAESGRGGEVREVGVFENRPDVLRKVVARLGTHPHLTRPPKLNQRKRRLVKIQVHIAGGRTTVGNPRACYEPVPGPMLDSRGGSPETEPRSCGTQSAHESLFNRRLRVLSPAVRTNDRRSPRRRSKKLCAAS